MIKKIVLLSSVLLLACTANIEKKDEPIGYIGFIDAQPWAITFNDCTVYNQVEAIKYLWLDRSLSSISCYQFSSQDKTSLLDEWIKIYQSPNFDASYQNISTFSQLSISKSGWGHFPLVYQQRADHWFQVQEGWIHLNTSDRQLVQYYSGKQNPILQKAHDEYYLTH